MTQGYKNLPELGLSELLDPDFAQTVPISADLAITAERYGRYGINVDVSHSLSRRMKVDGGVGWAHGALTSGNSWETQSVMGTFSYLIGKGISAYAGYVMGAQIFHYPDGRTTRDQHPSIRFGVDYGKALSVARRTTLAFTTGVAQVDDRVADTNLYELVGAVSLKREFGHSWEAGVAYSRNVRYLEAINEPVLSNSLRVIDRGGAEPSHAGQGLVWRVGGIAGSVYRADVRHVLRRGAAQLRPHDEPVVGRGVCVFAAVESARRAADRRVRALHAERRAGVHPVLGSPLEPRGEGRVTGIRIRELDPAAEPRWDAFVSRCEAATFFHRAGWKRVIEESLGHEAFFLYAENHDGEIVGVLPLVLIRSALFGRSLSSTAFCVYGGPASTTPAAVEALTRRAIEIGDRLRVGHIEFRSRKPSQTGWSCNSSLYVTFRRAIDPDPETNLLAIPRKQRAMVRKGIKNGLVSEIDGDVDRLHADLRRERQEPRHAGFPEALFRRAEKGVRRRLPGADSGRQGTGQSRAS